MCLAIPGKIVEVEGTNVVVDYGSEKRAARIVEGDFSVGDFVIVQAGIVSEKVSVEQMSGWMEVLRNDR